MPLSLTQAATSHSGIVVTHKREVDGIEIMIAATINKTFKSGDSQTTMTVTVPQESNKHKVQSNEEAPRSIRARRGRRGKGNRKQE